eukprot:1757145-Amphidinium_carterae.1
MLEISQRPQPFNSIDSYSIQREGHRYFNCRPPHLGVVTRLFIADRVTVLVTTSCSLIAGNVLRGFVER